jgi:catechol 2,3-dioxygenase-like lactoylglutathione lyase family enzyme
MTAKIVPMIHVPDVNATAEWYVSIGFKLERTNVEDDETNWALLTFGGSELMFQSGGGPSAAYRREFDLYIHVSDVEEVARRLRQDVDVVEEVHDTFYGMREFIIRDVNRFWITFGQPVGSGS